MGMFVHADTESSYDDRSMFCHHETANIQLVPQSPRTRFTEEERDAINCVLYLATVLSNAVEGQDKRQDKRYTQSIATVKEMLKEVTP